MASKDLLPCSDRIARIKVYDAKLNLVTEKDIEFG